MWQKIKLILKSVRQYKKYAIITPIFMVVEAALECMLPFIMSVLIDNISYINEASDIANFTIRQLRESLGITNNSNILYNLSILGIILVLVGFSILSLTSGIIGGRLAARASIGMGANLRQDLYE